MDRISNLSDDLLLEIVSSLPTKKCSRHDALVEKMEVSWTMLPKLDFDYCSELEPPEYGKFIKYMDRSMVLNRAPVLQTLKFKVGRCSSFEDFATWIRIGMAREVRELEISDRLEKGYIHTRSSIILPNSLYTYEKLEVLKLAYVVVDDVPADHCFPSLKILHLVYVTYESATDESHRMLLSGCPVLEELVLDTCERFGLPPFSVEMPSLQRLSILDTCDSVCGQRIDHKVVINAPSLKYLNFIDLNGELCLSGNMPEVVEANVSIVHDCPEELLECLASVKRLFLCLAEPVLQHRIEFYHLLHLELCGGYVGWWDLLTWMLESSPKLQVLKLCSCDEHSAVPIEGHWSGPSSVPEGLMSHLHTFKWEDYCLNDEEKKIVAYILKNARELMTAAISVCSVKDYSKKKRSRKHKELASLPRASSSCQLILK
ncbi:unnamed protein product [Microthlaspi erraticum]|uniref:FBD domain-containing protein n=1 Tax=Microthlaspi erraticum TaxID=1685480 RepID=A0A6D2ISQ2_9BRAS|nr:unnamed protein product [Microthlaspi erraticum]